MGRRKQGDRAWYRWNEARQEWQVTSVIDGLRTRTAYQTEKEAEREVRKVMAAVRSGQLDCPASWTEAVESFIHHRRQRGDRESSLEQYGWRFKAVAKTLGEIDPLVLSRADAAKHRATREAEGRSPVTIAETSV